MISIVAIYLAAVAFVTVVGVAAAVVFRRIGVKLGLIHVLPLGAATSVTVMYGLGYLVRVDVAAVVLLALSCAVTLAGVVSSGLGRVRPDRDTIIACSKGWLRSRAPALAVVSAGVVGGLLWLVPLFRLGFPTTIAATIADGWTYVSMVEWLSDHTLRERPIVGVDHPLENVLNGQFKGGFSIGFELLGTAVATLVRRQSYEVINAVSAISLPVSVTGWAALLRTFTRRTSWSWSQALVVSVGASPLLMVLFTENQAPHCLALAMWPFAVLGAVEFGSRPTVGNVLLAGVGSAALIGVYPALVPWWVAGLVAGVAVGVARRQNFSFSVRRSVMWIVGSAGTLAVLLAVTGAMGPFQMRQALRFVGNVGVGGGVGVTAPRIDFEEQGVLLLGARAQRAFAGPTPIAWSTVVLACVVVALLVTCVWFLLRTRAPGRDALIVLGAVVLVTLIVVIRFRVTDEFGYAAFKASVSGGALIAGLVIVGLVIVARSAPRAVPVAVAALALIWIPVSAELLKATTSPGAQGFDARDIELGRALRADVSPEETVLVEGAAEGAASFQLRQAAAYFGVAVADRKMEGLGSTRSYVNGIGGGPEWRPAEPWSYVVTNRKQPVLTDRSVRWRNANYTLSKAPQLDVTPYGIGWYETGTDRTGAFAWTNGQVTLVVSNRGDAGADAVLTTNLSSNEVDRRVVFRDQDGAVLLTTTVRAGHAPMKVSVPLHVPARSVRAIDVAADPGPTTTGSGALPLALRFQGIAVSDGSDSPDG